MTCRLQRSSLGPRTMETRLIRQLWTDFTCRWKTATGHHIESYDIKQDNIKTYITKFLWIHIISMLIITSNFTPEGHKFCLFISHSYVLVWWCILQCDTLKKFCLFISHSYVLVWWCTLQCDTLKKFYRDLLRRSRCCLRYRTCSIHSIIFISFIPIHYNYISNSRVICIFKDYNFHPIWFSIIKSIIPCFRSDKQVKMLPQSSFWVPRLLRIISPFSISTMTKAVGVLIFRTFVVTVIACHISSIIQKFVPCAFPFPWAGVIFFFEVHKITPGTNPILSLRNIVFPWGTTALTWSLTRLFIASWETPLEIITDSLCYWNHRMFIFLPLPYFGRLFSTIYISF